MNLLKYKIPKSIYFELKQDIENKKYGDNILIIKVLKEELGFYFIDIVYKEYKIQEIEQYEIIVFKNIISHGSVLDAEYLYSCCQVDSTDQVCESIEQRYEFEQLKKQKLKESNLDYYGI
jgi:hypothetical protein